VESIDFIKIIHLLATLGGKTSYFECHWNQPNLEWNDALSNKHYGFPWMFPYYHNHSLFERMQICNLKQCQIHGKMC